MTTRCLYLTNCYAPPDQVSVGAATRHYYHVQALAENSIHVDVVTSAVSTISGERLALKSESPNIDIKDFSVGTVGKDTLLSRMSYHVRYFVNALGIGFNVKRPAVVIASIPTLLIGCLGYLLARFHRADLVVDVRDLWTDSLKTTNLARIPLFLKVNAFFEKFIYGRARLIYCTSQAQVCAVRSMVSRNVRVILIPNGLDPVLTEGVEIHPFVQNVRKQYKWVGLFAGKHAKYTALDTLVTAAKALKQDGFALVLLGGGYTKQALIRSVRDGHLDNVFFHDPVPKSEVAAFEAGVDFFFINYSSENAWGRVLPNKTFDYMYWNKPVIAGVVRGEITRILEKSGAGVGVEPENPDAIVRAVRGYLRNGVVNTQSRDYLIKHFDRKKLVKTFALEIQGLT